MYPDGWTALAIEPIFSDHLPSSSQGSGSKIKYKPYRRIGILYSKGDLVDDRTDSHDWHWFEDGQWELVELF